MITYDAHLESCSECRAYRRRRDLVVSLISLAVLAVVLLENL